MYREGLLILSIILIVIGAVLLYAPLPIPGVIGTAILWIGIIVLIIWIVLFVITMIKSGA